MKSINKFLIFLLFLTLGLSNLEAKTLKFLLNHTIQGRFTLNSPINLHRQEWAPHEHPSSSPLYFKQLKIKNIGNQPIKNCLPYINHPTYATLEGLAHWLSGEEYPLLALYQLWNRSIIRLEGSATDHCHPLDLLNFKGHCSPKSFDLQFIKLCQALGIETRLANIHGKTLYDFCCQEGERNFLDLASQQFYLSLDNRTLISSEEVMDDPFLALRTQPQRQARQMDIKQAWEELARFEILDPVSADPFILPIDSLKDRPQGFDLYPHETLIFQTPAVYPELANHECRVKHCISLKKRKISSRLEYFSPFPIQMIENRSSVPLLLVDQNITLQPKESLTLTNQEIFHVSIDFHDRPQGGLVIASRCAWTLFPSLISGKNELNLGAKENPTVVRLSYRVDETLKNRYTPVVKVDEESTSFERRSPYFNLENLSDQPIEKIWWQISPQRHFQMIPSNFDQVEPWTSEITLSAMSETFLNPDETYYFRVKGCVNGQWSEWSSPYAFTVHKPAKVEEVEFDKIEDTECYELNWERFAEESSEPIKYLIFGSNSFDFIPSIYCDRQINAIVDGEVIDEEEMNNLVTISDEPKVVVKGGLAYYRIVAKRGEQFSVPSSIIHVYDQDLIQPRNVLQIVTCENHQFLAKRQLFRASYPWTETSLPHVMPSSIDENGLIKIHTLLRSAASVEKRPYQVNPYVSPQVWQEARPYFLPENHPAKPKLDRLFSKRVTLSPETLRRAGFKRWQPGHWSRVVASSHPEIKEYFCKIYCDTELNIKYDWKRWIYRIEGARLIRSCIKRHQYQSMYNVPRKWVYPLPAHPSPPKTPRFLRKNFILVADNMRIVSHEKNRKLYKKKMTREKLDAFYTILQECGLYDSVFCFNCPFCKDGRIALIDTEYHHKWPVPFHRLTKCFSQELRPYWEKITRNGGHIPDGVSVPHLPRQDRRDW